jgi:filamentous hemagglutinin family protein
MSRCAAIFLCGGVISLLNPLTTLAQIVPDDTLGGERSSLQQNVPVNGAVGDRIEGGSQRGANLFHSFQLFNVTDQQRVYFAVPGGVDRIFARITGDGRSTINGTLGTLGNADLFLINPNGILFGRNARLDIRGSFVASTASSFRFADGREFSATNPQVAPLLTVNLMPGLQYGASRPGATIVSQGNLSSGQDLTLISDRLDLQGQLQAGRNLTLQAADTVQIRDNVTTPFLAQSGRHLTVQGNQNIDILALNHLPNSAFVSGGDLTLIGDGPISADTHFTSGGNLAIRTRSGLPGDLVSLYDPVFNVGGDYSIGNYFGPSLQVTAGGNIEYRTVAIAGIDPAVHPTNPALFLTAGGTITGTGAVSLLEPLSRLLIDFESQGDISTQGIFSQGGDVRLVSRAGSITTNGEPIDTTLNLLGTNNTGGNITLTARENISIGNLSTVSNTFQGVSGNGGNVLLRASSGSITTGEITTYSSAGDIGQAGNGGVIRLDAAGDITAESLLAYSSASILGTDVAGLGGNIDISTVNGDVTLRDLDTSSVSTNGNTRSGGAITIQTQNGNITTREIITASFANADNEVSGAGGAVYLRAMNGNIDTFSIETNSFSAGTNGGFGGAIRLEATGDISSSAIGGLNASGTAGRGDISISTQNGNLNLPLINASGGGMGGNITLTKRIGRLTLADSVISSDALNFGNGGQIQFNAEAVSLINTEITATSANRGDAGQIRIATPGLLTLDRSRLFTSLEQGAIGTGGIIQVQAGAIALTNFSLIDTATFAQGNAGTIQLVASDSISLQNSGLSSITNGEGDAGNITVQAGGTVLLRDRSSISTAVNPRSTGEGGEIRITADRLELCDGGQVLTNSLSQGQAGNIVVTTTNGVVITGTNVGFVDPSPLIDARNRVTASRTTPEVEPNDSVNQPQRIDGFFALDPPNQINPEVRFSTRIPYVSISGNFDLLDPGEFSRDIYTFEVTAGTRANFDLDANTLLNTTISLMAARLTLYDIRGNELATAGMSEGLRQDNDADPSLRYVFNEAGTYAIEVRRFNSGFEISDPYLLQVSLESPIVGSVVNGTLPSGLFARTEAAGNAGSITINTPEVWLRNQGRISVETTATGNAGGITLSPPNGAPQLTVNFADNTQITASTSAAGTGGNITLTAPETILLQGDGALTAGTTGPETGGNVFLRAEQLTVRDGAQVTVSSRDNAGRAGNIEAVARSVLLDNQGRLIGETTSGDGGNITLRVSDLLQLRRNSSISTSAGTSQSGGDGGNITIDSQFIVSVLSENNDIRANAFTGNGGNVNITTQGIFGIQFQPFDTPNSDITASSQFGINGTVTINTSGIDPTRGTVALPTTVSMPLLAQGCRATGSQGSRFVNSGRGGLPTNPSDPMVAERIWQDLGESEPDAIAPPPTPSPQLGNRPNSQPALTEAQGWVINPHGSVVLTASAPTVTPYGIGTATECSPVATHE